MPTIDRWVIRNLFTHQGQHYRQSWNRFQLQGSQCLYTINLSGASLNDEQFIEFVIEQFALHEIPPQVICFEITETVAISNLSKAAALVGDLKALGCRFTLDDFGSSVSCLAYLKNLPVDYLKIDGNFVRNIVNDPINCAMVEAINQIAHLMGLQTIAEFVENDDILNKLRELGVDYAQGYGIAKPHPLPFQPRE
jgi:EAL domain-containing protein (putative c-di-GMP-specific phosphodiesterase class I)